MSEAWGYGGRLSVDLNIIGVYNTIKYMLNKVGGWRMEWTLNLLKTLGDVSRVKIVLLLML